MKKFLHGVFYVVGTLIICFVVMIVVSIISTNTQEATYVAAMTQYRDAFITDEVDFSVINELAEKTYSDGKYGLVEKASKDYIYDIFMPYFMAQATEEEAIFKNGVTKELIEEEQPDFKKSLETITEMREYLAVIKEAANTLFSREEAFKYLAGYIGDYYEELFEEQVAELYEDQEMKQDYLNYVASMQKKCDAYAEVINFLKSNNGSWHLDGDVVVFKTTWLTNQYNQLLEKINQ